MKGITFRCDEELRQELEEYCYARHLDQSTVIRTALVIHLSNWRYRLRKIELMEGK